VILWNQKIHVHITPPSQPEVEWNTGLKSIKTCNKYLMAEGGMFQGRAD
jgi:hypothetical protein